MTIRSITIYLDDAGRPIEEHRPVPNPGEIISLEAPTYVAPITGQINGPQGPISIPLKIVLDGVANVHEAFAALQEQVDAKAPAMLERQVANMRNRAVRQSLAHPGG